ncbi:MAG: hypothetical protein EA375_00185 [Acholeplasmataceae bacterium]|nr:MAG: hypothetical protein EA375_00185 [Acholeplasmataceae bacterium]
MPECERCGADMDYGQTVCYQCGYHIHSRQEFFRTQDPDDPGGWPWLVAGLIIPPLGILLFIIWFQRHPVTARACGNGALAGFILWVVAACARIATTNLILPFFG